jgi:integrase
MTQAIEAMNPKDNYTGQFLVERGADGSIQYKFEEGDTAEKVKEYIQLLQATGQLPIDANSLQRSVVVPSDSEMRELRIEAKSQKAGGMWLSDLIQAYADEKLATEWKETTWRQTYRPLLRDFRELVSKSKRAITNKDGLEVDIWDIQAYELEEQHIQIYTSSMFRFPKNYGAMKGLEDAKQALNAGLPVQERGNAFKKLRMVKTFLIWAYKRKKLSEQLDILLPTEKKDKMRDKSKDGYQPWTEPELKQIFERENYPTDGFKYWTPLIALYTGARANEIAQLLVNDVKEISGIQCVSIMDLDDDVDDDDPVATPDDKPIKSLKTAASRRLVPIHPKLIEVGFLKFVERQKEQGEKRLFPELNYSEVGGYGRNVSRSFAEVTKRLGIWVSRKKVFHSFRSTFNGRLMKLGTPQELREFLLGHANDSMNVQAYGKQLEDRPYAQLYEEVKKVDFGLTHKAWEPAIELPSF